MSFCSSKAVQIRTACATLLLRLVNKNTPAKVLTQRDLCDKIVPQVLFSFFHSCNKSLFPQAIVFSRDPQPGPRQKGKDIIIALSKEKYMHASLDFTVQIPAENSLTKP